MNLLFLVNSYSSMNTFDMLFSILGVLLSVAFFTLMERKVMGFSHYRKGPNKIFFLGVFQPISDAMKLLTKEIIKLSGFKILMYSMGPLVSMALMLFCWLSYDYCFNSISLTLKILVIVSIMGLSSYGFIFTSWGSNSGYSLLGGYRSVAQIISYELCLMIFLMFIIFTGKTYSLLTLKLIQENLWFSLFSLVFFFSWVFICMAESNRTPFDLAEGESEIVSGFNIEYSGGLFALIFISEYGMIMVMSFLTSLMFLGFSLVMVKTFLMCLLFVWSRSSFPRVRYDMIMMSCWKILLPYSISMVLVSLTF